MLLNHGILFSLFDEFRNLGIRVLWKSQRRKFMHIGKDSGVLCLPYVLGYEFISIGDDFRCGKDVRLEAWKRYGSQTFNPEIVIGNNVTLTDRCYLSCINKIVIGDGVLFGREVFVADNSHGDSTLNILNIPPAKRPLTTKGPVIIGNNVWVGRQVTILSGVTIGKNSIIGANSVVNKDIPENCVAAGNPAVVIKKM